MAESGDSSKGASSSLQSKKEEKAIVQKFCEMRQKQRATVTKLAEFDVERKEHELVIETLKTVEPTRKCFRLIGGVLVEKTVQEVLPMLTHNLEQIANIQSNFKKQLETQGKELVEYKTKHNIVIEEEGGETRAAFSSNPEAAKGSATTSVLVAQETR